jgi:hypothetical protein
MKIKTPKPTAYSMIEEYVSFPLTYTSPYVAYYACPLAGEPVLKCKLRNRQIEDLIVSINELPKDLIPEEVNIYAVLTDGTVVNITIDENEGYKFFPGILNKGEK